MQRETNRIIKRVPKEKSKRKRWRETEIEIETQDDSQRDFGTLRRVNECESINYAPLLFYGSYYYYIFRQGPPFFPFKRNINPETRSPPPAPTNKREKYIELIMLL